MRAHPYKLLAVLGPFLTAAGLLQVSGASDQQPAAEAVDFERHIAPLLTKHGCNAGSCHGAPEGKAGFKLSLFGFDPKSDYESIVSADGGRIDHGHPRESLFLAKPSLRIDHEGGERFARNSWQHALIADWISQGARHVAGSGWLKTLEIVPRRVLLTEERPAAPIRVMATFADERIDVTRFADVRVDNDAVATVAKDSTVRRTGAGDTVIVAVYSGRPASAQVLAPRSGPNDWQVGSPNGNFIDRFVDSKLAALRIEPSPRCSDEAFLRRLMLSVAGRLPTPIEILEFLADTRPDKRARAIDASLADPLHAALWATRMAEITGSRDFGMRADDDASRREKQWHAWLRARFEKNTPYDELARSILAATTREGRSADQFVSDSIAPSKDSPSAEEQGYAHRATLDLFWQRPSVNEDIALESMAERIAAAFLGVRIECARCHKHPFDRWTQNDHRSFVNLFSQVRFGQSPALRVALSDAIETQRERARKGETTTRIPALREVYLSESVYDLRDPGTQERLPARPLGAGAISGQSDRRVEFAAWLTAMDNPFLARNFVNRIWAVYLGRGLVEPVDAFSAANPPTHPELLDALAHEFVQGGYDIRAIERLILNSTAWQRSSAATESNLDDTRNYARNALRVLPADVLVDAVASAAGDLKERAIERATVAPKDDAVKPYFEVFSRPERKLTCDCERRAEPTLRQSLLLLSDPGLRQRTLDAAANLTAPTVRDPIDEVFLRTVSRRPSDPERQIVREYIGREENRQAAFADVLWGLINTREFVTLH